MKAIDINHWDRKEIFELFSKSKNPFYMVTFRYDVTDLYQHVKKEGLSFYYAMVYAVTKAVNRVENFRYAIQDGQVVLLPERRPSFTDMKKGSNLFQIVTIPCQGTVGEFAVEARRASEAQKSFIDFEKETDAAIYLTCAPWLDITALRNEGISDPDDSIPRIGWGKFTEEKGRKLLCISMEVNHRFVDGIHLAQFQDALTEVIGEICLG